MCVTVMGGRVAARTVKPHREVGTVPLHLCKETLPAKTRTCKIPPLHHAAEVRNAVFHRLDATVASGIESQLRGVRKVGGLGGRQLEIHLEGDPLVGVLGTAVAAQVVLTRGEKGGLSFIRGAVVERGLPEVPGRAAERLHTAATLNADSRGDGCGNERCIQRFARKRGRGKRQRSLRGASGCGKANIIDGHRPKRGNVDTECVQVFKGFAA